MAGCAQPGHPFRIENYSIGGLFGCRPKPAVGVTDCMLRRTSRKRPFVSISAFSLPQGRDREHPRLHCTALQRTVSCYSTA